MKKQQIFISFIAFSSSLILPIQAQEITPANDPLNTVVNQNGNQYDITGGKLSGNGANLFHSFQKFGLSSGDIANFMSNPNIQNILGRVVGGDASVINGLIQVIGGNSNLYLMNPAGIIFGADVQLNVPADFFATTATGIGFGDNNWFNAFGESNFDFLNGQPLEFKFDASQSQFIVNNGILNVAESNTLALSGKTVISNGDLSGGNISITAVAGTNKVLLSQQGHVLNLEIELPQNESGELVSFKPLDLPELLTGSEEIKSGDIVAKNINGENIDLQASNNLILKESNLQATENINLQADNTLLIRDSIKNNFTAHAVNNINIEGKEKVDIFALNHPETPFISGGDLTLKSEGVVSGDAHFASAGKFKIEGDFISLNDPIVSSVGDVEFGNYIGVSLKVESQGSITGGNIVITGADTNLTGSDPDIPILTGGSALILRAGLDSLANPENVPILFVDTVFTSSGITGAGDVSIGGVSLPSGGQVIIEGIGQFNFASGTGIIDTNGGDITITAANIDTNIGTLDSSNLPSLQSGGDISLTAVGNITTGTINTENDFNAGGTGGDVNLNSGGIITLNNPITTASTSSGDGGNVSVTATGDIIFPSTNTSESINSSSAGAGRGGNITVNSTGGNIIDATTGSFNSSSATGDGGSIFLTANGFNLENITILTNSGGNGTAGNFNIQQHSGILALNFSQLNSTSTSGVGGNIGIVAPDGIEINTPIILGSPNSFTGGSLVIDTLGDVAITNSIDSNGANIQIGSVEAFIKNLTATTVVNPPNIVTDGGDLSIIANGAIAFSTASSTINTSGVNGGDVTLSAGGAIDVTTINAQGSNTGIGGNVTLTSKEFIRATETFTDSLGNNASISTAGGIGNANVVITHGGGAATPFIVGDATNNGTTGVISTTATDSIPTINGFPGDFTSPEGTVKILLGNPLSIVAAFDDTGTLVSFDDLTYEITGGQTSGGNLFHSFARFDVPDGQIANFIVSSTVNNLLARVVSGDASVIEGTVQITGGNLNLFLINPAGIVIGANAQLNVPGELTLTTANGIRIGSSWFSASGDFTATTDEPTDLAFTVEKPGAILNAGDLTTNIRLVGGTLASTGSLTSTEDKITIVTPEGQSIIQADNIIGAIDLNNSPNDWTGNILSLQSLVNEATTDLRLTAVSENQLQLTDSGNLVNPGDLVVGDIINPGGDVELSSVGTIAVSGLLDTQSTNGGNVTLTAPEIDFLGGTNSVSSATLNLQPVSSFGDIRIGGASGSNANTLDLTATDIEAVNSNVTTVNIGLADSTGNVTLVDNITTPINILGGANLIGADIDNTWNITDTNSGTVNNNINFNNIPNLVGGNAGDTFNLNNGTVNNISGGDGNNTMITNNNSNTININGENIGNINSNIDFNNIQNITTNSNNNTFNFNGNNPFLSGNINSIEGNNILDYNNYTAGAITVKLGTNNPGTATSVGGTINRVIRVVGNNNPDNILIGEDTPNTWNITGSGDINEVFTFTGIDNLVGGNDNDIFIINGGIPISIHGGEGDNTLVGNNLVNTWQIVNINQGNLNENTSFTNIQNLIGGETDDTFQFIGAEAFIDGNIDGINVNDTLDYTQYTGENIEVTLGENTPGTATGVGGTILSIESLIGAETTEPQNNIEENIVDLYKIPEVTNNLENLEIPELVIDQFVSNIESHFINEFSDYFGEKDLICLSGNSSVSNNEEEDSATSSDSSICQATNLNQAQQTLKTIQNSSGIKPALIYVVFAPQNISETDSLSNLNFTHRDNDQLQIVMVTPEAKPVWIRTNITRDNVLRIANIFRNSVADPRSNQEFMAASQKLYQLIIKPLQETLEANKIENLVFLMDQNLRSIPIAALHDGNGFIVEKYSVGLMPSLSLTDNRYVNIQNVKVLAMGADTFTDQIPLPSVPTEISLISSKIWNGKFFYNSNFTLENIQRSRKIEPYGILHLATHGEFQPGKPDNSYIQLWDSKLRLNQLRDLRLNNPPVELMVLSACRTALGNEEAELGFAGLANQAGVKTAVGSLWYVSDLGTLALMTNFYEQLRNTPIKAEALRQAQLAMIRGEVKLEDGKMVSNRRSVDLPPELMETNNPNLSHPYYWSSFTMIGNPW